MELRRGGAGNQIKDRIDDSAPRVFENYTRKPKKPHITDEVEPATVQKRGTDIGNCRGMGGDKGVFVEKRIGGLRCEIHAQ